MAHYFFTPLFCPKLSWHRQILGTALCCCTALTAVPATASPAKEKFFCTNAPRSQWISEAQARERFKASDYVFVKYKISSGNCHEFYAVDAKGGVVESYLHPLTGETVRSNRIPPPSPPTKP